MSTSPSVPRYRERLRVPARWWALFVLFVLALWLAMVVSTPAWVSWPATAVLVAAGAALLVGYGSARVEVDEVGLRAGRALLDWAHCGPAAALDAETARRLQGVDADSRAYLLLRPYVATAVRVEVSDRADPTPYWLVSSRRPRLLADSINAGRVLAH